MHPPPPQHTLTQMPVFVRVGVSEFEYTELCVPSLVNSVWSW